jgi:hypothetical protein
MSAAIIEAHYQDVVERIWRESPNDDHQAQAEKFVEAMMSGPPELREACIRDMYDWWWHNCRDWK